MSQADYSAFMYLNPDVCAAHGVGSVEGAMMYFDALGPAERAVAESRSRMPVVPPRFSPECYAASAGLALDVSAMDAAIRSQSLAEGVERPLAGLDWCDTLVQKLTSAPGGTPGSPAFRYPDLLAPHNLCAGDRVRLMVGGEFHTARVDDIDYASRTLRLAGAPSNAAGAVLWGVLVADISRVAMANLARGVKGDLEPDERFNPALYRLLYPDSRALGDSHAYADYVARRRKREWRAGTVDDIAVQAKGSTLPPSRFESIEVIGDAVIGGALSFGA